MGIRTAELIISKYQNFLEELFKGTNPIFLQKKFNFRKIFSIRLKAKLTSNRGYLIKRAETSACCQRQSSSGANFILIRFENSCLNEIPAFAGMTSRNEIPAFAGRTGSQEGQARRKDRLAGRTGSQEGQARRKDRLAGRTGSQEGQSLLSQEFWLLGKDRTENQKNSNRINIKKINKTFN